MSQMLGFNVGSDCYVFDLMKEGVSKSQVWGWKGLNNGWGSWVGRPGWVGESSPGRLPRGRGMWLGEAFTSRGKGTLQGEGHVQRSRAWQSRACLKSRDLRGSCGIKWGASGRRGLGHRCSFPSRASLPPPTFFPTVEAQLCPQPHWDRN